MSEINTPKTLVILAGGNGSRFGSAKQFAVFGENKKTLMEYNLSLALAAGFNHLVFITQAKQKECLENEVVAHLPPELNVDIVIQSLTELPNGCTVSPLRSKPLGTAHALWCAREKVRGAFVVINADDFYGEDAFTLLSQQSLTTHYAMVCYLVENTLSDYGGVNRGLCEHKNNQLKRIEEVEEITQTENGIIGYFSANKKEVTLAPHTLVSMNCWAFNHNIFPALESLITATLVPKANEKVECYLPNAVMQQMTDSNVIVNILTSHNEWFGVTYAADSPLVNEKINKLIAQDTFELLSLWHQ